MKIGSYYERREDWLERNEQMEAKLLQVGGTDIVYHAWSGLAELVFQHGKPVPTAKVRYARGETNGCHTNVARKWKAKPDRYSIATGYRLSDDGLWRQHSWLMNKVTGVLVETTVKGIAYYGVLFSDEGSERFTRETLGK